MRFSGIDLTSDEDLLVVAPPGCGKTELLARRADALVPQLDPDQRVLALTFSNKAKANLSARLTAVLGHERKRRYVTVHNFHGLAAELVRSHGATLGLAEDALMPEKATQQLAIGAELAGLTGTGLYEARDSIESALRSAKQGPYDDDEVLARLSSHNPRALVVEKTRQEQGQLFYDDLLRHAQRLLRVAGVARLYRARFPVVLVDEFQDLSPQQLDIALRVSTATRTFVGDPLQGIYSWTGARPELVERVLRRVCGEPAALAVSYRSSPAVLDVVAAVSRPLGGRPLAAASPGEWFEGGVAAGAVYPTAEAEARFIRASAAAVLERHPEATIGVICRNGWRRKQLDAEFASSGLPVIRWDFAVDDLHMVERLVAAHKRLGGSPSLEELRLELSRESDSTDVDTAAEVNEALAQLGELSASTGSLASALDELSRPVEAVDVLPSGVHLLNAHTGKGQQFDWVFVPGVEHGNVPSYQARSAAQIKEEHRVLLVMLSRARHGVVVTRAQTLVAKSGRPYAPDASRWASLLRPVLTTDADGLEQHIDRMP